MFIRNARAQRQKYDPISHGIMNIDRARESRRWLSQWSGLNAGPTPLYSLPGLSRRLGIEHLSLKDESKRSPLKSFKALGAPIALLRLILRRWPGNGFTPEAIFAGRYATPLRDFVVITATDGNHGLALAAAAQSIGCTCVVVLHENVSPEREAPIAALGARIIRAAGNYDDSVAEAARLAAQNGWQVISDTSYDGYEEIPRDVMQGYTTIADEVIEQIATAEGQPPFTHILLQGGVGSLAAGIVSYFHERYEARRPAFIVVEPAQADCLFQSAIEGRAAQATGSIESIMAGLACGKSSPLAWRFLEPAVDFFLTIEDAVIPEVMRALAAGNAEDIPIVGGESGVAGLAGLVQIAAGDSQIRAEAGIDASSRVLVINTEGDTAPDTYARLAGQSAEAVLAAQALWKKSLRVGT